MILYLVKRALMGLAVVIAVSLGVFVLSNTAFDPAIALAGESASDADIENVRQAYGLDRPMLERYLAWAGQVLRGDLGVSYITQRPAAEMVMERLPVTFQLAFFGLVIAAGVSLVLGVVAALRPGSMLDGAISFLSIAGQALPIFWVGLVLIVIFGVQLRWLPVSGAGTFAHLIMPSIALSFYALPTLLRMVRSEMIEVLASDFIRTARAKGIAMPVIVMRHALRNAAVPVVSVTSVVLGLMMTGSVTIESVFAINGFGRLAWDAAMGADLPVMQAVILFSAVIFVVLGLLSDLLNVWIDPRLRLS